MPELKDWINYSIILLNIFVTGIFSFLVWKATQRGVQLSESINNLKQKEEKSLRSSKRKAVIRILDEIYSCTVPLQREKFDIVRAPLLVQGIREGLSDIENMKEYIIVNFYPTEQDDIFNLMDYIGLHVSLYIEEQDKLRRFFFEEGEERRLEQLKEMRTRLRELIEVLEQKE